MHGAPKEVHIITESFNLNSVKMRSFGVTALTCLVVLLFSYKALALEPLQTTPTDVTKEIAKHSNKDQLQGVLDRTKEWVKGCQGKTISGCEHLPLDIPETLLVSFIDSNVQTSGNYDEAEIRLSITRYYIYRGFYQNIFTNRSVAALTNLLTVVDIGIYEIKLSEDPAKYTILIYSKVDKLHKSQEDNFDIVNYMKLISMVMDACEYVYGTKNHYVQIVDLNGLPFGKTLSARKTIHDYFNYMALAMPMRVTKTYIYNIPRALNLSIKTIKKLSNNADDIVSGTKAADCVPPQYLLAELGTKKKVGEINFTLAQLKTRTLNFLRSPQLVEYFAKEYVPDTPITPNEKSDVFSEFETTLSQDQANAK